MLEILVSISINEKYVVVTRKITVAADTGGSRKPVLVKYLTTENRLRVVLAVQWGFERSQPK